jgi:tRNA threonylcarbamoyl adenosine modification protein YjeE
MTTLSKVKDISMTLNAQQQTNTEQETIKIAAAFARHIKDPVLICLYGDLGMGKSVFARSLIRTLSGTSDLDVPSPTYTLLQNYDSPLAPLYHYDLYRLKDPMEIYELGWDDALYDGIVITEWSERIGAILPTNRIDIHILPVENAPSSRIIKIIDGRHSYSR